MANSRIPYVNVGNTINVHRLKFNDLLDSVGDVSTLTTAANNITDAINELDSEMGTISSAAMGTTANTVGQAIAELDGRLDSINDIQIRSPHLYMTDSAATSTIEGNLNVHSVARINKLDVLDSASIRGTLNVDGIVGGTITVNDSATFNDIVTFNDSINLTGDFGMTGDATVQGNLTITQDFRVDGDYVIVGQQRNVTGFLVMLDSVPLNDLNRAGLSVDRRGFDSAALMWNEATDRWEIGTRSTSDAGTDDMLPVARQQDSASFTNTYVGSAVNASAKITDLTNDRIVIAGTGGEIEDDANLTFNGTQLNVGTGNFTVQHATGNVYSAGQITADGSLLINDSAYITSNLVVGGDLTVRGTTTVVNTETIELADNIIELNSNLASNIAATEDAGLEIERGNRDNVQLKWDESEKYWVAASDSDNTLSRIATANFISASAPISYNSTTGAITHDLSGVTAGSYNTVIVDSKGHVTSGSNQNFSFYESIFIRDSDDTGLEMTTGKYIKVYGEASTTGASSESRGGRIRVKWQDTNSGGTNDEYDLNIYHSPSPGDDTTNTSSLAYAGTFTAITSVDQDSAGHINGINTTTYTLPAADETNTQYDLSAVDAANGKKSIRLTGTDASTDDVTLVGAGEVSLSRTSNEITITGNDTTYDFALVDGSPTSRKILRISKYINGVSQSDDDITIIPGTGITLSRSGTELTINGPDTSTFATTSDLSDYATTASLSSYALTSSLGSLATLSSVGASQIDADAVGASELKVSGNGTSGQYLASDGDGTFTWTTLPSGSSYSAGNGISLSGSTFSVAAGNGLTQETSGLAMSGSYTGSFTATGDITAYSDERLKSDVTTIDNALDIVDSLRGVYYTKDDERGIGVIAQETEKVLPEVVHDQEDGYKSVAYGNIVGVLIEAIKELKAEVEELKNGVTK